MKYNTEIAETVKYVGTVNIELRDESNKLILKKYHNMGGKSLFKFISMCLAGEYTGAEFIRPFKIKLFNNATLVSNKETGELTVGEETVITGSLVTESSNFISLNTAPTYTQDNTNEKFKACLHFLVPYTLVKDKFNQINLYGVSVQDNDDYSAYIYLKSEIDPSVQLNFNLIVNWDLEVSNK